MKDTQKIEEILRTQPHTIDGKAVECKIAVPKENMVPQTQQPTPEKIESHSNFEENSGNYNSRKIFVGGLPPLLKEGKVEINSRGYEVVLQSVRRA